MKPDINKAASGRWPELLSSIAGITAKQLTNEHQPCPLCGGKDRYRFDDVGGSGSWFCNQCGGKHHSGGGGNGMTLLIRKTGMSFKEAAQKVEQHLGLNSPPTDPPTQGAELVHHYSQTFIICRFPNKKIRPLTWANNKWNWKAPEGIRPLLLSHQLHTRPDAGVLIVEGEKTYDAACKLFPSSIICTWSGGSGAITKSNWAALKDRRVAIWPDNDDPGRKAADKIANTLHDIGCASISEIPSPSDASAAWDLADATEWTSSQAHDWVKQNRTEKSWGITPSCSPNSTNEVPKPPQQISTGPFQLLGYDSQGGYYYQPSRDGLIKRISTQSHTATMLTSLAPESYWATIYPGRNNNGVNWTSAASTLFEQQAAVGMFDPGRIRGRGAWRDANRTIIHLGDRLLVDGTPKLITKPIISRYRYQHLVRIDGADGLKPLTDQYAIQIFNIANRFHWSNPLYGALIAGWIVTAPICGALRWRPHIWLTAGSGSGKSEFLSRFLTPLLDEMALSVEGGTSEAGIRQQLGTDALPVILDEAESNEKADAQRMQNILSLARVASSESRSALIKGSPGGVTQSYKVRSMFFLSSIGTALKQRADRNRFVEISMRSPHEMDPETRQAHWETLDADLAKYITSEIGQQLMARTFAMLPTILESTEIFTRAARKHFGCSRTGDQYGPLLAGAYSLIDNEAPTPETAELYLAQLQWTDDQQDHGPSDERNCLSKILQHSVRAEAGDRSYTRTVGELIDICLGRRTDFDMTVTPANSALLRLGIRVEKTDGEVCISNTAEGIRSILKATQWENCWPLTLSRLPGSSKKKPMRFTGAGSVSRSVAVGVGVL